MRPVRSSGGNPAQGAVFVDGRQEARADLPEGLPDRPLPDRMQVGAVSSWIDAGPSGIIVAAAEIAAAAGQD